MNCSGRCSVMFNKVFKYDFNYVFRFWWIFAVTSLGVSVVGGLLVRSLIEMTTSTIQSDFQDFLIFLCFLGLFMLIVMLCFFPAASTIGCLIRYYKNFFSDEGYLTFTLPVSRTTLLNSKILNYATFSTISLLVLLVDALIIAFIGTAEGTIQFFKDLGHAIFYSDWTGSLIALLVLIPILLITALFMGVCVFYLSITIGSVISKKHKVLVGIGVYYGINMLLSGVQQLFYFLTSAMFFNDLSYTYDTFAVLNVYMLFSVILYLAIGIVSYCINLYCLKNKLNLS